MSARVRIVLVDPQEPGNVGAVTRVMKNFGLADLAVVGGRIIPEGQALWWSSGAEDLLESISYFATLAEAIADCHVAVATTSARGRVMEPPLTPAETADRAASLDESQRLAIVFGRENRGLTTDEVALCGLHATIPTDPSFPVMNLAQAVALFSYELSLPRSVSRKERDLAPADLEERMHAKAMKLLVDLGYLHTSHPEHLYRELRAVAARAELSKREVDILLGALAKLEWRLNQTS